MARTPRVAIVGGGIGGLTAALALHRRGIESIVCEQAPALSEIGAGLNLSPNAMKAFRALGIEKEAMAIGHQADFQVIRSWRSGHVISRQPRKGLQEQFGGAYLTVHRADLLDVLARAVPEKFVRLDKRCVAVESGARAAVARFADGSEVEADFVVGADGLHSAVRTSLFGPDAPRFTGCICYRGMVPLASLPPGLVTSDGNMWMGEHGHVVHYVVRRGELLNIVAHYDSDAWTEESWTRECDRSELMTTYARWHPSLLQLYECTERWYKWALYDRDPLAAWSKGRATLLGDAAHPMLPYLGQGACMAIEDGVMLAAEIDGRPDDPVAALQAYEAARLPRTRRAQLGSRARALENHLPSPWARLKRDIKYRLRQRFAADKTIFQAAWLYSYDVGAEAAQVVRREPAGSAMPTSA